MFIAAESCSEDSDVCSTSWCFVFMGICLDVTFLPSMSQVSVTHKSLYGPVLKGFVFMARLVLDA